MTNMGLKVSGATGGAKLKVRLFNRTVSGVFIRVEAFVWEKHYSPKTVIYAPV